MMRFLISIFFLTTILLLQVFNQEKNDSVKWQPSTIKSIKVGKSKYKELVKYWGKPKFEQEFTDEEDSEMPPLETKTEVVYHDIEVDGEPTNIGAVIGDKTKIVKTISLFFDEMMKEEAIKKYGSNYYLVLNSENLCVNEDKQNKEIPSIEYPIKLVYPQKGMFIVIRNDNTVMSINYTDKCQ